jgi:hypothetical protein
MAATDQLPPHADDCPHGWNGHETAEQDADDERPCPFGSAAAAQACAGVASLPARAVTALAPSAEVATVVFVELTDRDLLLAAALFHPPRS